MTGGPPSGPRRDGDGTGRVAATGRGRGTGRPGPAAPVGRRLRELLLGARLALAGGREAWLRTALTAVGVSLGVALLLGAASLPNAVQAREQREAARAEVRLGQPAPPRSARTLLSGNASTQHRGDTVYGRLLEAEGPRAPAPPGLPRLPAPGETYISPALADRLREPGGDLLRARLGRRIAGEIGSAGLNGPRELYFYTGARGLDPDRREVTRLDAWGEQRSRPPLQPILLLLVAVAVAALVMPVAVFIATAVRFGGESRDRRLAALRLVGADRAMAARMAAGEALLGAVAGVALGAVLFVALRPLAGQIQLVDLSVFASDIDPSPLLAALVVVGVPVTAVGVTLLALRRIVAEPLGVVRRAPRVRRRLWWRLVLPAAGLVLLAPLLAADTLDGDDAAQTRAALGVILLLAGLTGLLPWLVERVVARLGDGPVPWQLAIRRLQLDSGTASRVVNGVAVAVAAAVALQMLMAGAEREGTVRTGADLTRAQAVITGDGPDVADRVAARVPGVHSISTLRTVDSGDGMVVVGSCAALRELADLGRCADGDAFRTSVPGLRAPADPGTAIRAGSATWRVPAGARMVPSRRDPGGREVGAVLATPAAVPRGLARDADVEHFVRLAPGSLERVRTAIARIDPLTSVLALSERVERQQLVAVRSAVSAGAVLALILIGASLLVDVVEQLRERRRLLAELVAFGVRRGTIGWSLLWQAAVPVALGIGSATVVGVGLGAIMLEIADQRVSVDVVGVLLMAAAGAALVLLVTAASLPALWRTMRAEGLRTE